VQTDFVFDKVPYTGCIEGKDEQDALQNSQVLSQNGMRFLYKCNWGFHSSGRWCCVSGYSVPRVLWQQIYISTDCRPS